MRRTHDGHSSGVASREPEQGRTVSVDYTVAALGNRGWGRFLFMLAIVEIASIGGIPGLPALLALIIAIFAVQIP